MPKIEKKMRKEFRDKLNTIAGGLKKGASNYKKLLESNLHFGTGPSAIFLEVARGAYKLAKKTRKYKAK